MSPWRLVGAGCLLVLILMGLEFARPGGELRDYGSFVASGRAAGQGENPYGVHPLTFHVVLPGFDLWNPNLNPPISLPLFQLFDRVDPHTGFRAWWIISLGCYTLALALLVQPYRLRERWLLLLWAAALAGFWDSLALGQIYLPLVLATVAAWRLLDRGHSAGAGLLIGIVVAMKPNFAVWPALLLLAGHLTVVATAAVTFVALWMIPLLLYGPPVYREWIELLLSDRGRGALLTNASLPGLAQRMDLGPIGLLLSIGLLALLAVWSIRQRPDPLTASSIGLLGGVLASPIAWVHYTLFLLPIFLVNRWNALTWGAGLLLIVPVQWVLSTLTGPAWVQLTLGSVYNWAVLLCFIEVARSAMTPAAKRPLDAHAGLAGPPLRTAHWSLNGD